MKKVLLEISQNLQENTCARISFLIKLQAQACKFIKKETLIQVLSCEFCKISINTFFTEYLRTTASGNKFVCKTNKICLDFIGKLCHFLIAPKKVVYS